LWKIVAAVAALAPLPAAAATPGEMLHFLLPWDFSPTVLSLTLLALSIYIIGLMRLRAAGRGIGFWRPLAYIVGVVLIYLVLQTRFEYYAAHMFFLHRIQHLVLHHLGPFLIALSWPPEVLRAGLPSGVRERWLPVLFGNRVSKVVLGLFLHPVLAPLLFVFAVGFWLIPSIHFAAMLNLPLYNLMNWSMVVDGLPFWLLVLDPRPHPPARINRGLRILLAFLVIPPQIVIGAYIGLSTHDLFSVYAVCGRVLPISAIMDQQIGGLIIWVPASMMSVLAALIALSGFNRDSRASSRAAAAHRVQEH
jgi:Predicted membrane protein